MVFTLIHLFQAHPPAKVSWLLWTVAIVFFLLGLALLIYLMTRSKETEAEEVEGAGGRGLLATVDRQAEEEAAQEPVFPQEAPASAGKESSEAGETMPLFSEADFKKPRKTSKPPVESLASVSAPIAEKATPPSESQKDIAQDSPAVSDQVNFAQETEALISAQTPLEQPSADEAGGTKILSSQQTSTSATDNLVPPSPAQNLEEVTIPFAAQEENTPSSQSPEEDIFSPQEEALLSQSGALHRQELPTSGNDSTIELASRTDDSRSARLGAPVSQAGFEQPAKPKREPFEPPTIAQIAPKQAATEELSSPAGTASSEEKEEAKTTVLSSQSSPKESFPARAERRFDEAREASAVDTGTQPLTSAATGFKSSQETSPHAAPAWETQGAGLRSIERKPAGSVLGLPAETSHAPLILGKSSSGEAQGVAALTNYGKDPDAAETGRGGAIALLIAVLIVGGSLLAYFFIPSVHSYTNNLVARIRGQQPPAPPAEKPKAQIFPSRTPEVNKNMVKVRGAVTNISDEQLEGLQVEVSLDRGEGTASETRTVPVNPNTLAPSQRGVYELEYEGSKATGFSRYKVTKLLSKNGEVKFSTPNP
jgi:hypothetical protein